ncbi:MAG: DUF58 domain-containing protein [Anaerolineaceae bacterium]|nr:DUF58 domain-containing protein [Anaerolineaceae bacterium]
MPDNKVFDEKTRRKLEQVMLISSRVRAGAMKGERRSTKRGTSIEFADYRNYARGDDLRRLDWNVYARLQRPYIKLLEDEEDLAVHILLDTSASMDWPNDAELIDENKFVYARRLAAGLAYASLTTNDRMMLSAISDTGADRFGPARGRARGFAMLDWVGNLRARGVTDLNIALRDYAVYSTRPGLLFIISDMFSPSGHSEGIRTLMGKGYEVVVLHVLSPDEINPPLNGDLRLVDVETGTPQEVTIDASMREIYTLRLNTWRDDLRLEIMRRGGHYLFIDTSTPWERIVLQDLRRLGLLK